MILFGYKISFSSSSIFNNPTFFWQREFLQNLKTALTSAKGLTESSAIACVKLCKCATYVKPEDNSVLCFLVLTVMNELKVR